MELLTSSKTLEINYYNNSRREEIKLIMTHLILQFSSRLNSDFNMKLILTALTMASELYNKIIQIVEIFEAIQTGI